MSSTALTTLKGSCFCKHVQYAITLSESNGKGEGVDETDVNEIDLTTSVPSDCHTPSNLTLSAYCHCTSCQRLNASPFVWTTHWKRGALRWINNSGTVPFAHLDEGLPDTLQVFEAMPGRKFRLRCKICGSTIGSYHVIRQEWTIWGPTLEREQSSTGFDDPDSKASAQHTPAIKGWELIKPTAHQFYGTRILDVNDGLSRWVGYEAQSERFCEQSG